MVRDTRQTETWLIQVCVGVVDIPDYYAGTHHPLSFHTDR